VSEAAAGGRAVVYLDVPLGIEWAEFRDAVLALPRGGADRSLVVSALEALRPFDRLDGGEREQVAAALAAHQWIVGTLPLLPESGAPLVRRTGWTYVVRADATGVDSAVLAVLAAVAEAGSRPGGRRTWERVGTDDRGRTRWRLECVEPSYGRRVPATVLEANVDDMPAEVWTHVQERLFRVGARDVWFTPIGMKKSRPAVMVSVLSDPDTADAVAAVLFEETTTLGLRRWSVETDVLDRRIDNVTTPYGAIPVKVGLLAGRARSAHPEYEAVADAARRFGVPFRTVYDAAVSAWQRQQSGESE
jgi:hypothetical protein